MRFLDVWEFVVIRKNEPFSQSTEAILQNTILNSKIYFDDVYRYRQFTLNS